MGISKKKNSKFFGLIFFQIMWNQILCNIFAIWTFLILIPHCKILFEKLYLVKLGPNFVGLALSQGTSNHNFLKAS